MVGKQRSSCVRTGRSSKLGVLTGDENDNAYGEAINEAGQAAGCRTGPGTFGLARGARGRGVCRCWTSARRISYYSLRLRHQ